MIDPAIFICEPIHFERVCKVYPPTVKDVISNPNFGSFQKLLTISQEDLEDEQRKNKQEGPVLTPLEFLLNCAYNSEDFRTITQAAFMQFIHEPVTFLFEEKKIIIGNLETEISQIQDVRQLRILSENNYFDFQNAVRAVSGMKEMTPPIPDDPNEDPRVTAIKRKARERDRIKAKQKNKDGIHFSTCLAAICCMGIGITPLNIGELSYASISVIMNMMQEKEKYDIDIRSLLAGASSKKVKPKYWIRNNDN